MKNLIVRSGLALVLLAAPAVALAPDFAANALRSATATITGLISAGSIQTQTANIGTLRTATGVVLDNTTTPRSGNYESFVVQNSAVTGSDIIAPQIPPGHYKGENIRSTMVVPAGTTTGTNSAFGFYVRNDSTADAVGVFGTTVCNKNNAPCWAFNPTVIDHTANGVDTSAFNFGRILVGSELDVQVTSRDTIVSGYNCTGSSSVQPKGADCFQVGHMLAADPSRGIKWSHGLSVGDGTSFVALQIGADGVAGSNVGGMQNLFNYRNATGEVRAVSMKSTPTGGMAFGNTQAANGLLLQPALLGQFPVVSVLGSDANASMVLKAQGTGQVIAQSLLSAPQGFYAAGTAQFAAPVRLQPYKVASLPICAAGTIDSIVVVADAQAPSYRGALTGGGTVRTLAYCDGNAWTAH